MKVKAITHYQKWDSDTEQWIDFPEFIQFHQPTWVNNPERFPAWVIKRTPKGKCLAYELMREMSHG